MKRDIHPELHEITAHCACGNTFKTKSVLSDMSMTLCSSCHPFYTGEVKYVDTAGRIEKFNNKFNNKRQKSS